MQSSTFPKKERIEAHNITPHLTYCKVIVK